MKVAFTLTGNKLTLSTAAGATGVAGTDVTECDREPISVPESIQPHGALLLIDEADLHIRRVSANAGAFVNAAVNDLIGAPLSRALGPTGDPVYVFGIALIGDIGLNKLPLIGKIPGVADLTIKKLGFYYTSAVFTTTLNKLIFTVAALGTETSLSPTPDAAFLAQPKFSLMAIFVSSSG